MKIKLGMVGGGPGSMIGSIHRAAAWLDNQYELVCGAFSTDFQNSLKLGRELGLENANIYSSYREMFAKELTKPLDKRAEVVSIVTPNHLHYEIAELALQLGFQVILDKPITHSLAEAKNLQRLINQTASLFCVTYTFSGYPMIKEARHIISMGKLGKIRKIFAEFPQGWLSTFLECKDNKQAKWRTNPVLSGISGTMADIGIHAFHLMEYTSGIAATHVCANVNTLVPNRLLDDDGTIFLKFADDVDGVLCASQIFAGEEANLKLKIYGEKGGLVWEHDNPNTLFLKWLHKPAEILRAGYDNQYLSSFARHNCRTPAGHPEGYIEAFANHYRNFALTLKAKKQQKEAKFEWNDFPKIEEGVRGMAFIEAAIASGKQCAKWLPIETN